MTYYRAVEHATHPTFQTSMHIITSRGGEINARSISEDLVPQP